MTLSEKIEEQPESGNSAVPEEPAGTVQDERSEVAGDAQVESAPAPAPVEAEPEVPAAPDASSSATEEKLVSQLKQLSADFENYRRRSEVQVRDSIRRGQDALLEQLVPVLVDLQAAVQVVAQDANPAIRDGVQLVLDKFYDRLRTVGYQRIATRGERMDPTRHEALFTQPSATVPAGTVLDELAPGFERDGRVVLAAKVSVARGE